MNIESINAIGKIVLEIKNRLDEIEWSEHPNKTYGEEDEYTYKGLLGGLQSLTTDLNSLVNHPTEFLKRTTAAERTSIKDSLEECLTNLEDPEELHPHIDQLKTALRPLQLRHSRIRAAEFNKELDNCVRKAQELTELVDKLKQQKTDASEVLIDIGKQKDESGATLAKFQEELATLNEKREELEKTVIELSKLPTKVQLVFDDVEERQKDVVEILDNVKVNEKLIDSFSQKVQLREKRLDEIEATTKSYEDKLSEFTIERNRVLQQAQDLVKSAKEALRYKTAEGISAAFESQYEKANNKTVLGWWITGSIFFVIIALVITIWIVSGIWIKDPNSISSIVGRVVSVLIAVSGATFCANQYVKQKNIAEDYAYKAVLSKSIIAFTEEIKQRDGRKVAEYLTKVLEEIHKDPLRERNLSQDKSIDVNAIVEKLSALINKKS